MYLVTNIGVQTNVILRLLPWRIRHAFRSSSMPSLETEVANPSLVMQYKFPQVWKVTASYQKVFFVNWSLCKSPTTSINKNMLLLWNVILEFNTANSTSIDQGSIL